jgi:hypothetical protein
MLHGLAHMGIAFDPEALQEPDCRLAHLAESVRGSALTATTRPVMQ